MGVTDLRPDLRSGLEMMGGGEIHSGSHLVVGSRNVGVRYHCIPSRNGVKVYYLLCISKVP